MGTYLSLLISDWAFLFFLNMTCRVLTPWNDKGILANVEPWKYKGISYLVQNTYGKINVFMQYYWCPSLTPSLHPLQVASLFSRCCWHWFGLYPEGTCIEGTCWTSWVRFSNWTYEPSIDLSLTKQARTVADLVLFQVSVCFSRCWRTTSCSWPWCPW